MGEGRFRFMKGLTHDPGRRGLQIGENRSFSKKKIMALKSVSESEDVTGDLLSSWATINS